LKEYLSKIKEQKKVGVGALSFITSDSIQNKNPNDDIDEGFDQAQMREVDNTAQVSYLYTSITLNLNLLISLYSD
jgi:hypothetical protein